MNKKEISEIKKQFSKAKKCITRICGCYFDIDGNKKLKYTTSFLNIPEEEDQKYLKIFSSVFSGKIGKTLHCCSYDKNEEMHGTSHRLLMSLRDSELNNETIIDAFYDHIIEKLPKSQSYLILLAHCLYDVPVKGDDGFIQSDESDSTFSYIVCAVCPVELSDSGLSYNEEENKIENRFRDWIVSPPQRGFLFPAFTDRSTDIHSMLYYTKKQEYLQDDFLNEGFGLDTPVPVKEQKETFEAVVTRLGAEAPMDMDIVTQISDEIEKNIEAHKDDSEPLKLDKNDIRNILDRSGVSERAMSDFDEIYSSCCEDNTFLAENISSGRKVNINVKDIKITVPKESMGFVETKIIDGKKCLVITADDEISLNGIPVDII